MMADGSIGELFPRQASGGCLVDEAVDQALQAGAAVAIGVSGGKDSQACAIAVCRHLDMIGHTGPRILIHSDLGLVEWTESAQVCADLAARLGVELVTVRRPAGGLMERWETRWESSVRRYAALETVTLVLPWSTPSMRFCTSELKTHVITAEIRRRFRGLPIVNVTGQRREESAKRRLLPVSSLNAALSRPGIPFLNWHPILHLSVEEVFGEIAAAGLEPHIAYTLWKSSRVSCRFCIMSSIQDLAAAANDPGAHPLLRRMVRLELRSTFAFQGARWLCDVKPDALGDDLRAAISMAKHRAAERVAAEKRISPELLYEKGWPTFVPSSEQAALIAEVRSEVARAVGIEALYLDGNAVRERYAELIEINARRAA